jgi:TIR domain
VAVTVLLCYDRNHEDESMAIKLNNHLAALTHNGTIEVWDHGSISPGTDWQEQMNTYLSTAQMILLLTSDSFIASKYYYAEVIGKAIERHERKEARVIPVLLRRVYLKETPLGRLKPLPDNEIPISKWTDHDDAYTNVVQGIAEVAEQLETQKLPDPPAERKAIMENLDQLIANVRTRLEPPERAQHTADTLQQLSTYIPVDVTLADLVLGWRTLSRPAQPDEYIATERRRITCRELADLASELTAGQGNLQRAIKTWDAWSKMFEYRAEGDPRQNSMVKTFTRELGELQEAAR